ncbi:C-type lectin 37Db [Drosophila virilis]|uniref:C-type lectin domain-containing protein n=1 Tax=Drosophila virilis TaxID=7244 RepID=A0A0Q9WLA3_DROVI|nr:C-type lectin 37Db [Drosophila virilis]KRF81269.1 uncharacterized protein Dvir_GJ27130 [Drosophila virilis]
MKEIFVGLLITFLAAHGSSESISDSLEDIQPRALREGECFGLVRPLLEHAIAMHKWRPNKYELSKLNNVETLLNERFDTFEKNLNKKKLRPTDTAPFKKIGDKYYFIENNQKLDWFGALHKCHSLDGHLASLQNDTELDALKNKLSKDNYWVDVNDLATEGTFQSITTGLNATFLKWGSGEPNDEYSHDDCVGLRKRFSYDMNDADCEDAYNFVCEKQFES